MRGPTWWRAVTPRLPCTEENGVGNHLLPAYFIVLCWETLQICACGGTGEEVDKMSTREEWGCRGLLAARGVRAQVRGGQFLLGRSSTAGAAYSCPVGTPWSERTFIDESYPPVQLGVWADEPVGRAKMRVEKKMTFLRSDMRG